MRNRTQYQLEKSSDWKPIKSLYTKATGTARFIGEATLAKDNPTSVSLVLFKKADKGRHLLTRKGKIAQWTNSKLTTKREREPWLLATSLTVTHTLAKRTVKIHQSRMQTDLTFRNTKSFYYGIGFSVNRTKNLERLSVLLLLAAIASLILVLLGAIAEHKFFSVNFRPTR